MFVARAIDAAIDDKQRPARVSQGNDEQMVSPLALVVDVDAFLVFTGCLDHRTVS